MKFVAGTSWLNDAPRSGWSFLNRPIRSEQEAIAESRSSCAVFDTDAIGIVVVDVEGTS